MNDFIDRFQMPTAMTITGRSSSITNAFINAIIPAVKPTPDQVKQALSILGMTYELYQCAYCGDTASEWDHLRPLIIGKKPTGYISEIHNLVPSCGKCNQSKGNKDWKTWISSNAKLSPASRGVKDLAIRIARLETYEQWAVPTKLDFEEIVGSQTWERHVLNLNQVQAIMCQAQLLADEIKRKVAIAFMDVNSAKTRITNDPIS